MCKEHHDDLDPCTYYRPVYSCDLGIFCTPEFSVYEEEKNTRWVCVVAVSSWQFEKLRKQTQEELRNTLDQLLEAEVGVSVDHSLQTPQS